MISFNNTELIEGVIADRKSGSDGILYSYSKNPKRTVENITENIALVKRITGRQKKVPLLKSNHLQMTMKRENG